MPEVIYQFFKDTIIITLKLIKKKYDHEQIVQFILTTIANVLTFFGFCIYIELIELRFCYLNENIRKNIILRGFLESEGKFHTNDNDLEFGNTSYIVAGDRDERESLESIGGLDNNNISFTDNKKQNNNLWDYNNDNDSSNSQN